MNIGKYVIYADIGHNEARSYIGIDKAGYPVFCSERHCKIFNTKEQAVRFIDSNKSHLRNRYAGLIVDNRLVVGELNIWVADYVYLNELTDIARNSKAYVIWSTIDSEFMTKNVYLYEDKYGDMESTDDIKEAHLYSLNEARELVDKHKGLLSKVLGVTDGAVLISALNMSINLGLTECH